MPLHLHAKIPTASLTRRGLIISSAAAWLSTVPVEQPQPGPESSSDTTTLSNIPQTLSGECRTLDDCKRPRIQRPKSRKAESCTGNCLAACTRGGGEGGGLNIRGPLVVFKQGFRSRQYCLVECSDICNLLGDQDYGYGP